MSESNEIDRRVEWLWSYIEADDPSTLPQPPDNAAAAAAALGDTFGWWYDPVLGPETALEMVQTVIAVLNDRDRRTPS